MRVVLIVLLMSSAGCKKRELGFDQSGVAYGTGWKEYHYKSGALQLAEYYENGQLEKSVWYTPGGVVIREEKWVNGSGTVIYLREDGSIRKVMPCVDGVAHGMAIVYGEDGEITEIVEYVRGVKKD